jgi:glycosyltransferase involved in cell wall biosynthesis
MRIVLDCRKYFDFGIGTYIQNLVEYMRLHVELVLLVAPEDVKQIAQLPQIQMKINSSGKYSLRELRSIGVDANNLKADIFHAPHYTTPYGLKMPCVTTIHDILHVRGDKYYSFPKRMYARAMIAHACTSSAAILVDSEFTKQELIEVFSVNESHIHVVHLGVSKIYFQKFTKMEIQDFKKRHGIVKPMILYTGSLKAHKNIEVLIAAYTNMKQRLEYQIAFSGESISGQKHLWDMIKQKGIIDNIVELGRISNTDLALAYHSASVVVLPSLYEGFGFSLLESMAAGTPVIGAKAGSIPEVIGDSGVLFGPHSVEELTCALGKVLDDSAFRSSLIQKGFKNISRFSWEKCAEETFKIYQEVL